MNCRGGTYRFVVGLLIAFNSFSSLCMGLNHDGAAVTSLDKVVDYSSKVLLPSDAAAILELVSRLEDASMDENTNLTSELDSLFNVLKRSWKQCDKTCRTIYSSVGVFDEESFIRAFYQNSNTKMSYRLKKTIKNHFSLKVSSKEIIGTLQKEKESNTTRSIQDLPLYQELVLRQDTFTELAKTCGLSPTEFLLKLDRADNPENFLLELNRGGLAPGVELEILNTYERLKTARRPAMDLQNFENLHGKVAQLRTAAVSRESQDSLSPSTALGTRTTQINPQLKELLNVLSRVVSAQASASGGVRYYKKDGQDAANALAELHARWGNELASLLRSWSNVALEVGQDNPWGIRIPDLGLALAAAIGDIQTDGSIEIGTEDENGRNTTPIRGSQDLSNFFRGRDYLNGDRLATPRNFWFFTPDKHTEKPDSPFRFFPEENNKNSNKNSDEISLQNPIVTASNHGRNENKEVLYKQKANELTPNLKANVPRLSQKPNAPAAITTKSRSRISPKQAALSVVKSNLPSTNPVNSKGKSVYPQQDSGGNGTTIFMPGQSTKEADGFFTKLEKAQTTTPKKTEKERAIKDKFAYTAREKEAESSKEKRKEIVTQKTVEVYDYESGTYQQTTTSKLVGETTKTVYSETIKSVLKNKEKKTIKEIVKKVFYGPKTRMEEAVTEYNPQSGKKSSLTLTSKNIDDSGKIVSLEKVQVYYALDNEDIIERRITTRESSEDENPVRIVITEVFDSKSGKLLRKSTEEFPLVAKAF